MNRRQRELGKLADLIPGHSLRMVEVGVYSGVSIRIWLETGRFTEVTGVDRWSNGYDPQDGISQRGNMVQAEAAFDEVVRANFSTCRKIKAASTDAAEMFEDHSLDFVYLDATHQYEDMVNDFRAWLPKIKPTGAIGGHDYSKPWPGVRKAVDEFFGQPEFQFGDYGSWLTLLSNIKGTKDETFHTTLDGRRDDLVPCGAKAS